MANAVGLRPYQQEALRELVAEHQRHHRILLSLPTGTGKTLVAARYVGTNFTEVGRRTVWIAHSQELLDQAYRTFTETLGVDNSLVARRYAHHNELKKKLSALVWLMNNAVQVGPEDPDLIVIDEAHHAPADTYRDWLSTYRAFARDGAKVLGLTATPYRLDRGDIVPLTTFAFSKPQVPIFETVAYQRSFCDLAAEGFVAPFRHITFDTKMQFRMKLGTTGDFDGASLENLNTKGRNQFIFESWNRRRKDFGKTLIFVGTQKHAKSLAKLFGDDADYVVSDDHKDDRSDVIARFRNGHLKVLVNVGIFKEGVDVPDIRTVILGRPTTSPVLFTQMVGRGSRILPDKRFFYLVDIHDQLDEYEHYLASIVDLGDRHEDQLVELVGRRGKAAEAVAGLRVRSLANDKAVLAELLQLPLKELLTKFVGWVSFEGERDTPLPVGALLTADEFTFLEQHVENGRLGSAKASAIEERLRRTETSSLTKCARALREGLTGKLQALRESDFTELEQLHAEASIATGLPEGPALVSLAHSLRSIGDQARSWGAPESNIGKIVDDYASHRDRYAAMVKLASPAGSFVRLVTDAAMSIITETVTRLRAGGLSFGDAATFADQITAVEPDLEGHAMRLVDAIAREPALDAFCMRLK